MGGIRVLLIRWTVFTWDGRELVRGLTMRSRLDPRHRQNLLDMLRLEIRYAQAGSLERPILNQVLQNRPKLPDLALLGNVGGVDEQQVGRTTELVDSGLNGFADILGIGLDVCLSLTGHPGDGAYSLPR